MSKTINNKNDPPSPVPPTTTPERCLMESYTLYPNLESSTLRIAHTKRIDARGTATDMGKRVSSFILNACPVWEDGGWWFGVNSIHQFFSSFIIFSRFASRATFERSVEMRGEKEKKKSFDFPCSLFSSSFGSVGFMSCSGFACLAFAYQRTHTHATQTINQSKSFPLLTMPHLLYGSLFVNGMELARSAPRHAFAIPIISALRSPEKKEKPTMPVSSPKRANAEN